jgi:hypothetical protein
MGEGTRTVDVGELDSRLVSMERRVAALEDQLEQRPRRKRERGKKRPFDHRRLTKRGAELVVWVRTHLVGIEIRFTYTNKPAGKTLGCPVIPKTLEPLARAAEKAGYLHVEAEREDRLVKNNHGHTVGMRAYNYFYKTPLWDQSFGGGSGGETTVVKLK